MELQIFTFCLIHEVKCILFITWTKLRNEATEEMKIIENCTLGKKQNPRFYVILWCTGDSDMNSFNYYSPK